MNAVLERLLDLLVGWFKYLLPFYVLGDDHIGLIRRIGKYRRDMAPGLNWKWPVIEEAMTESAALESVVLREQTLTTADGHSVTLSGVLSYRVVDARKYILGCNSAESVLSDIGCCVISEQAPASPLVKVLSDDFDALCLKKMRTRAKQWGVEIVTLGFADRVAAKTYRLLMTNPTKAVYGS